MQFPIYQVPYLGNGMTIALVAVLHVIISHGFAIGAMTMIVLSEYMAFRRRSDEWESFAKDYIKFSIIIITSLGSVSGVGIWLITSALAPRGIGSLLRVFFWPWLIEWGIFVVEVILIMIYYYTWRRWTERTKIWHIRLGLWYVFFAMMSATLISGILGFMLTPDDWPWDQSFWSGFFNITYAPQLALRLSVSFALGALISIAVLLFTGRGRDMQIEGLKIFGKIFGIFLPICALSGWWYFTVVPSAFKTFAAFSVLTSALSQIPNVFWAINGAGAAFLLLYALCSVSGARRFAKIMIIPAIICSMGFIGEFERIREFIRGPYLVPGYMYVNQILMKEKPYYDQHGMLDNAYWYQVTARHDDVKTGGAFLFGRNCSMCHTIGGLNDIRDRVKGRTLGGIFVMIGRTQDMVPFMPPFAGTREERRTMARFLYDLSNGEIEMDAVSRFTFQGEGGSNE